MCSLCSGCRLLLLPANCLGAVGPADVRPACTTDPVQGSTTQELLSCSAIKKDIELQRSFGESSLQDCISQRQAFLLTLFWRLAVSALCSEQQPSFVKGSTPPWVRECRLVRTPFFVLQTSVQDFSLLLEVIFSHVILWHFSVGA